MAKIRGFVSHVTTRPGTLWQSLQQQDTKQVRFAYVTAIHTRLLRYYNLLIFYYW